MLQPRLGARGCGKSDSAPSKMGRGRTQGRRPVSGLACAFCFAVLLNVAAIVSCQAPLCTKNVSRFPVFAAAIVADSAACADNGPPLTALTGDERNRASSH
ncbi:hypothetical protein EVAR_14338_1, partial [Eumeta japonica]